jgi:hypothetical protein
MHHTSPITHHTSQVSADAMRLSHAAVLLHDILFEWRSQVGSRLKKAAAAAATTNQAMQDQEEEEEEEELVVLGGLLLSPLGSAPEVKGGGSDASCQLQQLSPLASVLMHALILRA